MLHRLDPAGFLKNSPPEAPLIEKNLDLARELFSSTPGRCFDALTQRQFLPVEIGHFPNHLAGGRIDDIDNLTFGVDPFAVDVVLYLFGLPDRFL